MGCFWGKDKDWTKGNISAWRLNIDTCRWEGWVDMSLENTRGKKGGNRSLQAMQVKTRSFCLIWCRNETRGEIKRQEWFGLSYKVENDLYSCILAEHEQGERVFLEKNVAEIQGHWMHILSLKMNRKGLNLSCYSARFLRFGRSLGMMWRWGIRYRVSNRIWDMSHF